MKIAGILALLCGFSAIIVAQESAALVGTVHEIRPRSTTREKVVAKTATVMLTSKSDAKVTLTAVTNSAGQFFIENIPPGEYVLVATRPAEKDEIFTWIAKQNVKLQPGDRRATNLLLEAKNDIVCGTLRNCPYISETVTISADRGQPIEQVSKTVNIIDGQEMRDRADFSLVESLRTIPGFRVQQSGGFGRVATIKTRGLRNQDTAVLLDGVRFRDPTTITGDASSFLSDLTLTSVSKVEVLRGSGSSLYGTNAVGGVIDLQTPTARSGTHGQVSGAFGGLGLGRFRGNLSHGARNGRFGIGAALARTVFTKGIDGDDNAYNTNFQSRVDASPWARSSISGSIFLSDARVRLNSSPDTFGTLPLGNSQIIAAKVNVNFVPDINDLDARQQSRFFSGKIAVNQVINTDLIVSGYYHGLKTKRTNDNGPLGPGFQSASTSVFDGQIHTGNAHLTWSGGGRNTLTAGYEYEREKYGNDGFTPNAVGNFFTRAGQQSNAFYAQNLLNLLDNKLQLAGGFRIQRYSLSTPGFSLANAAYNNLVLSSLPTAYTFDGSASYFVRRSGTKFRTHVGNGYRVPSLYERFGTFYSSFGTPSFIAIGDPLLKPEKTIAFDAGVEQSLSADRVRLSATYFYTRLNDIIGYGNVASNIGSTPRPFGGYENQRGGLARGGEFSIKSKPTNSTDIFASYTFTNSDQRTPQVSGSGVLKTLGVPDHQFTLVATQRFRRLWVNFDFLATSKYLAPIFSNSTFSTYIYRFKGNRRGDLTTGYTFAFPSEGLTLRVFGTVENIFNQTYFENGFKTARANGRVGLSFGF